MLWTKKATKYDRYYYAAIAEGDREKNPQRPLLFEQSLDIYKPIVESQADAEHIASKNLPIVIMVVGSGWIGHRAIVYASTSFWNSSGPKTIASLGCTCVCIRHRGAFCVLPSASVLASVLAAILAVFWAALGWQAAVVETTMLIAVLGLLARGGRGSAQFEDMLQDVAKALAFIESNKQLLKIEWAGKADASVLAPSASGLSATDLTKADFPFSASKEESDMNSKTMTDNSEKDELPRFVFGGYSSGGHVAATLLQRPDLFEKNGLPSPDKLFHGIIMISGMLAVRPEKIDLPKNGKETVTIETPSGPTWLTDFVLETVWGPEKAQQIPSPLAQLRDPKLPHLLKKVQHMTGEKAKYVEVESDHWNILSSVALRDALQENLPTLIH